MGPNPDPYFEPVANYGYGLSAGAQMITRWTNFSDAALPTPPSTPSPTTPNGQHRRHQRGCEIGAGWLLLGVLMGGAAAGLLTR